MIALDIATVTSLRAELWDAGYRPIPVFNADAGVPSPGKQPLGKAWQVDARKDPPFCARSPAVPHALNTGILADEKRPVDIDINDRELALHVRTVAIDMLGDTLVRTRDNSGRCLLLYRAAKGSPPKRVLTGHLGKIEVLGHGQQFVALGVHPSGAELRWFPVPPQQMAVENLPALTEQQITEFFLVAAPLIGADPPEDRKPNGKDGPHVSPGDSEAVAEILDVMAALIVIPNDGPADWDHWNKIGMATWAASKGTTHGLNAWCAWSAKNPFHDDAACGERWQHYPSSPPDQTGAGKLFALAAKAMPGWERPSESRRKASREQQAPSALRVVNPVELEMQPVTDRVWIVQDWLPAGCTTANYGDGGAGKTLLAQQLQTSCATGKPWCGHVVRKCRSLGLYCEDDETELHRRQDKINDALDIRFSELGDMRWTSGVGQDNTLAIFTSDGRMQTTPRWNELTNTIMDFGATLVVLDTAADLFAGNENDRNQVRRFISLLNGLAAEISGAVLLNAHPSRAGLSSGNLDGGSTAWSNTVRSRWSLGRPQGDDNAQPDTNERILARRKANYATVGDTIRLKWVNGVLVPLTPEGGIAGAVHRAAAETVFLDLLDRCETQRLYLSPSRNAGNFAPKQLAKRPDAQGYMAKDFESAMSRLFAGQQIKVENYGRTGDPRQRIVRDARAGA